MADIVDDFIQRLRAIVPDVPAHAVQQLEVRAPADAHDQSLDGLAVHLGFAGVRRATVLTALARTRVAATATTFRAGARVGRRHRVVRRADPVVRARRPCVMLDAP